MVGMVGKVGRVNTVLAIRHPPLGLSAPQLSFRKTKKMDTVRGLVCADVEESRGWVEVAG